MRPLRYIPFVFLITIFLFPLTAEGKPPINKDAEAIAKAIPAFKPGGNKQAAEQQMKRMIQMLAATKRNSVSSNSAILSKAMDFREDIGAQQQAVTIGAILKAWETAYDLGALNRGHIGQAGEGRYSGERLVFENIVPQEMLPEAAGYIGNLRLVPSSRARKKGDELSRSDKAYAIGLKQVMHEHQTRAEMLEIQKSKVGHLAQSKAAHEERWQREINDTGDAYKNVPNLRLVGQRKSTPSKLNGNTYSMDVEITNLSRHPTEVEIVSTIVGYTEKNNLIYELKRDTRVLKLRRSQVHEYQIRTPNVSAFKKPLQEFDPVKGQKGRGRKSKAPSQPVIYRGYTIVAKFNGKVIATTGSDGRMMRVASGEYDSPARILALASKGGSSSQK